MSEEPPWIALKDVCHLYGRTFESAKNAIKADRFPVSTYKVGRTIVIDRVVHENYFSKKRDAGLRALDSTES